MTPEIQTGVIAIALVAWALREIFGNNKSSVKENTKATMENTLAITELKVELKHIHRALDQIPAIRKDLDGVQYKLNQVVNGKTHGNS